VTLAESRAFLAAVRRGRVDGFFLRPASPAPPRTATATEVAGGIQAYDPAATR
jgi:hypothetical protein